MAMTKRPAAWSWSTAAKPLNSRATVSASVHTCGDASSTTKRVAPSATMRRVAMPLRSSATLKSSAARSTCPTRCLSSSTPSTRWMPPCRSSPRLIVRCGGYRYQAEASTTATTMATRTQRYLRILVALSLHYAPDGSTLELQLDLVGDTKGDRVLVEAGDGAV